MKTRRFDRFARQPYVRGLPEWDMFPSEEERLVAIESIEGAMVPRDLKSLLGFLVAVTALLAVPWIGLTLLVDVVLPNSAYRGWILFAGTIVCYAVGVNILIRRSMRADLREALLETGVPVCLKCGYLLKGLRAGAEHCPECGRTINERTRMLVSSGEPDQP